MLFDVQWLIDFNDDQVNLDVVPWFPWFARIHIVLKTIGNLTKKWTHNVIFYDVKTGTLTCVYYIFVWSNEQSALVMRLTVFPRKKKMFSSINASVIDIYVC